MSTSKSISKKFYFKINPTIYIFKINLVFKFLPVISFVRHPITLSHYRPTHLQKSSPTLLGLSFQFSFQRDPFAEIRHEWQTQNERRPYSLIIIYYLHSHRCGWQNWLGSLLIIHGGSKATPVNLKTENQKRTKGILKWHFWREMSKYWLKICKKMKTERGNIRATITLNH